MAYGDFGDDFGEQSNPGTSAAFGGDTSGGFGGGGFDAERGDYTGLVSNNQTKANGTNLGTKNEWGVDRRKVSFTPEIKPDKKKTGALTRFDPRSSSYRGDIAKVHSLTQPDDDEGKSNKPSILGGFIKSTREVFNPNERKMSPDAYRLHSKGSTVPHGLGVQRSNLSLSQASALASGMSKFNTPGEKALSTGLGIAGKIPGLGWLGEAAIRGVQTASYMSKTDPYGSKPPSGGFEAGPSPEQHRKTPKAYASYQPNKTTLATAPSTRRRESTMSAGNVYRRGNRGVFYV